ncbi:MAG: hypothetical protein JJT89_13105 [Nitriliruptoraceae bacterium]|nr:hypothetical protein [Nitriliruptoraceae bacterium]
MRTAGPSATGTARGGRALLAASCVLALTAGCTPAGDPPPSAALLAALDAPAVVMTPDAAPGVLASEEAVLDASALRLTLEQLLGDHVLLVADTAAAHAAGLDVEDAMARLEPNTDALVGAIGLVYGEVGADAFASLWTQHIAFLLDHARGTGDGDREVVEEAEEHLHHYEQGFGTFTATATEGALPADVVADLLGVHVADITGYVDARLAGDEVRAVEALIGGHDLAADIGAALATTIADQGPNAFPRDVEAARGDAAAELARSLAAVVAIRTAGPLDPTTTTEVEDRTAAAVRALVPPHGEDAVDALVRDWLRGADDAAESIADLLGDPALGPLLRAAVDVSPSADPVRRSEGHAAAYAVGLAVLGG